MVSSSDDEEDCNLDSDGRDISSTAEDRADVVANAGS